MNCLQIRRSILALLLIISVTGTVSAGYSLTPGPKNPEKRLFGKSVGSKKKDKVKEPRAVRKAKKKQEANEKRLKKEYAQSVKKSRERAYDIQSAEVKERMKQNEKDIIARDKEKKKNAKARTKKGEKKYT